MRLLPLVALLGAAPLLAQQPLLSRTLDSGTVVRLLPYGGPAFQGVLLAPLTPEAQRVVFSPPAQRDCSVPQAVCRVAIAFGDVRAIEVRRGSRAGRGALIGAVLGGWVGFFGGLEVFRPPADGSRDVATLYFTTLVSGALGAGIGALFGRGSPGWERAP